MAKITLEYNYEMSPDLFQFVENINWYPDWDSAIWQAIGLCVTEIKSQ